MGNCNEGQCSTDKGSCGTESKGSGECTLAEDLVCLAKEAKHELLKEKMKKELDAKIGKKLDSVAKLAVEAALACLAQKIEAKEACDSYKARLYDVLKSS